MGQRIISPSGTSMGPLSWILQDLCSWSRNFDAEANPRPCSTELELGLGLLVLTVEALAKVASPAIRMKVFPCCPSSYVAACPMNVTGRKHRSMQE